MKENIEHFYGIVLGVGWLVSLKTKFKNKNNPASTPILLVLIKKRVYVYCFAFPSLTVEGGKATNKPNRVTLGAIQNSCSEGNKNIRQGQGSSEKTLQ